MPESHKGPLHRLGSLLGRSSQPASETVTFNPPTNYNALEQNNSLINESAQKEALESLRNASHIVLEIRNMPLGEGIMVNGLVRNALEICRQQNPTSDIHLYLHHANLQVFLHNLKKKELRFM